MKSINGKFGAISPFFSVGFMQTVKRLSTSLYSVQYNIDKRKDAVYGAKNTGKNTRNVVNWR